MQETWLTRLKRGRLRLDGGLGSSLIATGQVGAAQVAAATVESPELLLEVHHGFLAAGAEVLFTNTFGASRPALAAGAYADRWEELNRTAVALAQRAAREHGGAHIVGDLGPIGLWSREHGATANSEGPAETAAAGPSSLGTPQKDTEFLAGCYREQAAVLAQAGVDALVVETLPSEAEARLALAALRETCDLPIAISFTTTRSAEGFTTLAGEPVAEVLAALEAAGADALGLNCGEGSGALLEVLPACLAAVKVPLFAKPNAEQPTVGELGSVYLQSPEAFADDLARAVELGASAVGGCCGADARFIAALRARLADR